MTLVPRAMSSYIERFCATLGTRSHLRPGCLISAAGPAISCAPIEVRGLTPVARTFTSTHQVRISTSYPLRTTGYRSQGGTFDVVVSNSVLEHVRDIDGALLEIHRVLKPGGASLHFFPPMGKPIEPHVFVPLGGLLRAPWWLALWAFVGVRNRFQQQLDWREVARGNRAYLTTKTFYRSKRTWQAALTPTFEHVTFADRTMLRHSYGRTRYLAPVAPLVAGLYGACHWRCVFFEKRATPVRPEGDAPHAE